MVKLIVKPLLLLISTKMKEKIKKIILEIIDLDQNPEQITNLISDGHLDSFETLMLINSLETEFQIKFDFNDDLIKNLDSIKQIAELIQSKSNSTINHNQPTPLPQTLGQSITHSQSQPQWEQAYSSDSFHHKNEYPNIEVVSFIMGTFGNHPNKSQIKILDLGCGWGNNLKFLKDKGFDYYGIDFSNAAITHCQTFFQNVTTGDISQLPYSPHTFDCIIDRMSIQHNSKEKIHQIFQEIHRVLKPGGYLLSFLVAQADYQFPTSYLTKEEIQTLAQPFTNHQIDYSEYSINNQSQIFKTHILTAQK